jgi:hypothetical protein
MVDPQPRLVELLVRHVLLPREFLTQIEINSNAHHTDAGTRHLGAMPPTLPPRHLWTAETAQWVPVQRRVCSPGPALKRGQPHTSAPKGHTPGRDGAEPVVMHDESRRPPGLHARCLTRRGPQLGRSRASQRRRRGARLSGTQPWGQAARRPANARASVGPPPAVPWSERGLCDAMLAEACGRLRPAGEGPKVMRGCAWLRSAVC